GDATDALSSRAELVERLFQRIGEALRNAEDFIGGNTKWALDRLIEMVERSVEDGRLRLLENAISDGNVLLIGEMAADCVSKDEHLPRFGRMVADLVSRGRLSGVASTRRLLQAAAGDRHLPHVTL